jgi:hypothetical protein
MLNWVTPAIVENQPPILPLHSSLRLQAAHNNLVFPFTLLPYHHLSHLDDLAQGTALLWLVSSVHIAPPSISFDCVRRALHSFDKEACVPHLIQVILFFYNFRQRIGGQSTSLWWRACILSTVLELLALGFSGSLPSARHLTIHLLIRYHRNHCTDHLGRAFSLYCHVF